MDVRALILKTLSKKGEVRAAEIVKATGFSRVYVNRFFRELKGEGVLALVGKANKARYIPASGKLVEKARSEVKKVHRILSNRDLNEDKILAEIKNKTGIFRSGTNGFKNITASTPQHFGLCLQSGTFYKLSDFFHRTVVIFFGFHYCFQHKRGL